MENKLSFYVQLAGETAAKLTTSYQTWTDFLSTASRLYQYPFPDQLLIYAQRPDATACAEMTVWNQRLRRLIKRGSKGIALVDARGTRPRLRYVFDIADTQIQEDSCEFHLWSYQPEYQENIIKSLEAQFGIPGDFQLEEQLNHISLTMTKAYWSHHDQDILSELSGSPFDGLNEQEIRIKFCLAAAMSTAYILLARCDLHPKQYYKPDYFQDIPSFNTQRSIRVLGSAISQAGQVLHHIAKVILKYERQRYQIRPPNVAEAAPGRGIKWNLGSHLIPDRTGTGTEHHNSSSEKNTFHSKSPIRWLIFSAMGRKRVKKQKSFSHERRNSYA